MSEQTTETTETPAPESKGQEPAQTPPWGEDFNAEKAWKLVENLRADKERLSAREVLTPEDKQRLEEYKRLEDASQTELERAQKASEAAASRIKSLSDRAVAAEVKSAAAGKFADPSDALAFLGDLTKYVSDNDEIDTKAIADDLAKLIESKPHLAPAAESKIPRPNPAQGASGSAPESGTPQLSREDVSRLYREKKYDEIDQARQEGRLKEVLGG